MLHCTAFSRRHCLVLLTALLTQAVTHRIAMAEDAPAGLRVFYTGHSFHMFVPARVDQLAKSAGIAGHRTVGTQGIGGSRVIQHWELEDGKNKAKPALETGELDVFTMASHLILPDPGVDHFVELGLKHNPKLRLLVQASWMPWDITSPQQRIRDNAERDMTDLAALQTSTDVWRKSMEAQVDALNQKNKTRNVEIVPVGDAVNELRRQIQAGKFPGVAKPSELFRDPIGHGLGHIQALAAYCNYAVIYRRSPEGLMLNEPGVTPEQHAILQRIAWTTVSNYNHAGVKQSQ
ncbi:MAG: hypothetical protein SH850_25885 [Planctomycetaceae bacterium]|nr:hypothetical protein [Planctomycetaceae bacterium]